MELVNYNYVLLFFCLINICYFVSLSYHLSLCLLVCYYVLSSVIMSVSLLLCLFICSSVEEEVDEVDLPCLLLRRGMAFQDVTDPDRRGVLPERLLHHPLRRLVPPLIGYSLWIGIRKQDDLMPPERPELIHLHLPQSPCRQPHILRIPLTEYHRRLLRLHHSNGRPSPLPLPMMEGSKMFVCRERPSPLPLHHGDSRFPS